MTPAPAHAKSTLRKELRRRRRAVPERARKQAGRVLVRLALRHRLLTGKRRLGFYIPAKDEIDCLPMLDRALWLGAECYLPVVPGRRRKRLGFTRLGMAPHWRLNRYGIPEYGHRSSQRLDARQLDILFMPLLGFDERGYRMGMGGGYYDTSLAYLALRRKWHRPRLIGLAFETQRMARLPVDPWDIPLDGVITEAGFQRFNNAAGQPARQA